MLVLGMQVFIGNTGVLSFGHIGVRPDRRLRHRAASPSRPAARRRRCPTSRSGSPTCELSARSSRRVVARRRHGRHRRARRRRRRPCQRTRADDDHAGGPVRRRPGREELARADEGRRRPVGHPAASSSRWWLYVAAFGALLVAHWFQETRIGRFAVATREDEFAAPALGIRLFDVPLRGLGRQHRARRPRRLAACAVDRAA